MHYLIGVDIGGTFTDCTVMDEEGHITVAKSASTPHDFSIGVLDSVKGAADSMQMRLTDLLNQTTLCCHGSTVVTNAIINRLGAKAGPSQSFNGFIHSARSTNSSWASGTGGWLINCGSNSAFTFKSHLW